MLLLAAMLVALAAPAPSYAKGGDEVIRDCAEDGDLDGNYSQEELDEASENMPSDISEYSTCRDVIERARQNASAGSDKGGGSTPPVANNPSDGSGGANAGGTGNDTDELASRRDNSRSDEAPTASVAGEEVASSAGTLTTDAESDGMPIPLIVALALAALGAFLGALYLLRDQLPPAITSRLPGPLKPDSQA